MRWTSVQGSPRAPRLVGLALSLVLPACLACRTEADIERDLARSLLEPAPIAQASTQPAPRPVSTLQVRVHVQDAYCGEVLRCRQNIEEMFERANEALERQFGVHLAIASLRPWRRDDPSRSLGAALEELAALDEGAGADWVVGFVPSSAAVVGGSMETLGMARLFGKHLVLRGMVLAEERRDIGESLHALSEDEREQVMVDRRRHRETVVLLHEWAHTLGAFHERDGDSILCPRYERSASRFSEAQARIIELGLRSRAAADPEAWAAWARGYRTEVERGRDGAWDEAAVADALASGAVLEAEASRLAARAAPRAPERTPGPAVASASPPPAPASTASTAPAPARSARVEALAQAEELDEQGDSARAWRLVQPIAARAAAPPYLRTWACYLQRRARVARVGAECREVTLLDRDVASLLFVRVLLEGGDRAGGLAAAARLEGALAGAGARAEPLVWAELAAAYAELGACTAAERTAARVRGLEQARQAAARCARTRSRALLPRGAPGVELEQEPEYVEGVLSARTSLEQGAFERASSTGLRLAREFPQAAGGPWLLCLAAARGLDHDLVRARCRAAEAVAPWAPEPPFLLGEAEAGQGRWPEARDAFRRTLERDPLDLAAWSRLGAAYQHLGDAAALEDLRRRHQERFGMPLAIE